MTELNTPPPTSPPSSPSARSPSPSRSWAESLGGALVAVAVIEAIGRPLGQALPRLIDEFARSREWRPLVACLAALGLLVAPVPTLALVQSMIGRLLPGKKE